MTKQEDLNLTDSLPLKPGRVDSKLSENGQGKYLVSVRLTSSEVREVNRALRQTIGKYMTLKGVRKKQGRSREKIGYQLVEVRRVSGYLQNAAIILKKAEQARADGRYRAEKSREKVKAL
jgi:hypothetical protein